MAGQEADRRPKPRICGDACSCTPWGCYGPHPRCTVWAWPQSEYESLLFCVSPLSCLILTKNRLRVGGVDQNNILSFNFIVFKFADIFSNDWFGILFNSLLNNSYKWICFTLDQINLWGNVKVRDLDDHTLIFSLKVASETALPDEDDDL